MVGMIHSSEKHGLCQVLMGGGQETHDTYFSDYKVIKQIREQFSCRTLYKNV